MALQSSCSSISKIPGSKHSPIIFLWCQCAVLGTGVDSVAWFMCLYRRVLFEFCIDRGIFRIGDGRIAGAIFHPFASLIFPVIGLVIFSGVFFSGFLHINFSGGDEFVWIGSPGGVLLSEYARTPDTGAHFTLCSYFASDHFERRLSLHGNRIRDFWPMDWAFVQTAEEFSSGLFG